MAFAGTLVFQFLSTWKTTFPKSGGKKKRYRSSMMKFIDEIKNKKIKIMVKIDQEEVVK